MREFLLFGLFGWVAEIVWTALYDAVSGTRRAPGDGVTRERSTRAERWRLEGKTYLWMLPVYGGGGLLFVRVHALMSAWPWFFRGAAYCAGAFAVEAAAGWILRVVTGKIPWDYSYARASALGGAIRLDYAPLWFTFGFMLEWVERLVGG